MSQEFLTPLVGQLGVGGLLGFAVGYAAKKIVKLIVVLLGLALGGLGYLAYQGYIEVNWTKIQSAFGGLAQGGVPFQDTLTNFVSTNIPLAGGVAAGAFLGFRMG